MGLDDTFSKEHPREGFVSGDLMAYKIKENGNDITASHGEMLASFG